MSDIKYNVSSAPHTRANDSTASIMCDVLIALLPALIISTHFFGLRSFLIVLLTVAACVLFEALFQLIARRKTTITDFSAVVTGVLLAFNLPPSVPFWLPIVGAFVAIVIVKQLFGGIGQNFINPALVGRAFLLAAYTPLMTRFTEPLASISGFVDADSVSTATPLTLIKEGADVVFRPETGDYINALLGNIGGCIGETCAVALIIGGLYLIARKVITWHIPVVYILTVFILSTFITREGVPSYPLYELLTGGLLLGAFFMATDYTTSPVTAKGKLIMGFGCGFLTVIIRVFGSYPEGVSYAILLMNLCVPIINKFTRPRVFGTTKRRAVNGR